MGFGLDVSLSMHGDGIYTVTSNSHCREVSKTYWTKWNYPLKRSLRDPTEYLIIKSWDATSEDSVSSMYQGK